MHRRPILVALGVGGSLLGLLLAHLKASAGGSDFVGVALFGSHLYQALWAVGLFGLAWSIGRHLLTLGACEVGELPGLCVAAALGIGVLAIPIFILGWFGALQSVPLSLVLVCLAWLTRDELARCFPEMSRVLRGVIKRDATEGSNYWVAALIVTFGVAFLLVGSGPPAAWDDLMYHLSIPEGFLETGGIGRRAGTTSHLAYVGLFHMMYLPFLAAGCPSSPAILNGILGLLLSLAALDAATRLGNGAAGAMACTIVLGTGLLPVLTISARVDVSVAFFVFTGQMLIFPELLGRRRLSLESTALAGLIVGFAVGIKYLAVLYGCVLLLQLWLVVLRGQEERGELVSSTFCFTFFLLVGSLPWLMKNYELLGAPLYPFFAEPLLPTWLANSVSQENLVTPLQDFIWQLSEPLNAPDLFLAPERLSIEYESRFYALSPGLVLLPAILVGRSQRALFVLAIPALLYGLGVYLILPESSPRYLLPVLVPLAVAASVAGFDLVSRIMSEVWASRARRALLATAVLPGIVVIGGWTLGTKVSGHFVGATPEDTYLSSHFDLPARMLPKMRDLVANNLTERDTLLMMYEARRFGLPLTVLPDNASRNWLLLTGTEHTKNCLRELGITHVLIGWDTLRFYLAQGAEPTRLQVRGLIEFRNRCLTLINGSGEPGTYGLYRIRPTSNSAFAH